MAGFLACSPTDCGEGVLLLLLARAARENFALCCSVRLGLGLGLGLRPIVPSTFDSRFSTMHAHWPWRTRCSATLLRCDTMREQQLFTTAVPKYIKTQKSPTLRYLVVTCRCRTRHSSVSGQKIKIPAT
jgi:hypothetical protein